MVKNAKKREMVKPNPEADTTLWIVRSQGGIVIVDNLEIGAQSAIEVRTLLPTRIRQGTKIEFLTKNGNNVQIAEDYLLCGQAAIGRSTNLGNLVVLGGDVKVADHVTIGDPVLAAGDPGREPTSDLPCFSRAFPPSDTPERLKTARS